MHITRVRILEFNPTTTCGFATAVQHGDPVLVALGNNGGPTQTMALGAGSAALGTGDPAACAAAPVSGRDQRGYVRQAGTCSIGAFEGDPAIPNVSPPARQPPGGSAPGPIALPGGRAGGSVPGPVQAIPSPRP